MKPLIMPFKGKIPQIHPTAFIAPGAIIIGDVEIGENASVWYGCVLRGDSNAIRVGKNSNIQDGTIIHEDLQEIGGRDCLIGDNVLVGHRCMLHGCVIENEGFVGMCATILDHATIKSGGFLAAGAFLAPGKIVQKGEMWAGLPAKKIRMLKPGEDKAAIMGSAFYVQNAKDHAKALDEHLKETSTN